jgi:hypothetical protein
MASGSGLEMIGLTMIAIAPATALISAAIVVSLARGMFRGSPATPQLLPQSKKVIAGSSARPVVLQPLLLGRAVNLHPLAVVLVMPRPPRCTGRLDEFAGRRSG